MKPAILFQHPQTSASIPAPWVTFGRDGGNLRVRFRIPGDTRTIAFPAEIKPGVKVDAGRRADLLWEHTCFEVFIAAADSKDYIEINLSPSGEWAAYSFDDYRTGMRNADMQTPAVIPTDWSNRFELSALLVLPGWAKKDLIANFTVVVELQDGTKSYWALAHAPGPPDFHNRDCFVARLPPVTAP